MEKRIDIVALDAEARAVISTAEAAAHLSRAPQTLRMWACRQNGPIVPVRINGRLGWKVSDLRRLVGA